jgi:hypothetical protein
MKRHYAIAKAQFRRWLYLLFIGMWRGECAINCYTYAAGGKRLTKIYSGDTNFQNEKIWWKE